MKKRSILLIIIFFISIIILSVNSNNKYLVKEESLATYIDGEKTDSFPAKGTVAFSKAECDNNVNIYWDNDTWGLYATNLNEKTKCNLYFKTLENAVTKITNLASTDTVNIATDDPDNNIRYIGANPNNYIYFNCDDYNNQTSDTCELWRIIGVFNNIEKEDGTKENLIKIIREDSIGAYSWDTSDSSINNGYGSNNWTDASLMKLLNPGYDTENINNSLYFNSKNGICYIGQNNATTVCNFNKIGLKNELTRSAIESVIWSLGGTNVYDSSATGLAKFWYGYERSEEVYGNNPSTWLGKVGLIYISDYGYATSGGTTTTRKECLEKELYNWNSSSVDDCRNNDYLYKSGYHQWSIVQRSGYSSDAFDINSAGFVRNYYRIDINLEIRPTLYLKPEINVSGGTGSSTNPYQLSL